MEGNTVSNFLLRAATAQDTEDIVRIWRDCFGDPPALISELLMRADLLTGAVVAEADGGVRSAMFRFENLFFGENKAAYLYALCTAPAYRGRGLGRAVNRAIAEKCFENGAEIVFLSPADGALADWYAKTLGAKPLHGWHDTLLEAVDASAVCTAISPEEYCKERRSTLLLTQQLLHAQDILHRHCGGGFYRVALRGIAALACVDTGEIPLVRELICPVEMRETICAAIAAALGKPQILLREKVENGAGLVYITNSHAAFSAKSYDGFFLNLE